MTPEIEKGLRAAREILRDPPHMRQELEPAILVHADGSVSIDYSQNPFLGDVVVIPYPASAHERMREIAAIDARLAGGAA